MNGHAVARLRKANEKMQHSSIDSIAHQAATTLELIADLDRLRAAIRAHRAVYADPELASPNELRYANRQLWATIEEGK